MNRSLSRTMDYRGISIAIKVERDDDHVFGHADLYARDGFRGRLAIGAAQRAPEEVLREIHWRAKAKVDLWHLMNGLRGDGDSAWQPDF